MCYKEHIIKLTQTVTMLFQEVSPAAYEFTDLWMAEGHCLQALTVVSL